MEAVVWASTSHVCSSERRKLVREPEERHQDTLSGIHPASSLSQRLRGLLAWRDTLLASWDADEVGLGLFLFASTASSSAFHHCPKVQRFAWLLQPPPPPPPCCVLASVAALLSQPLACLMFPSTSHVCSKIPCSDLWSCENCSPWGNVLPRWPRHFQEGLVLVLVLVWGAPEKGSCRASLMNRIPDQCSWICGPEMKKGFLWWEPDPRAWVDLDPNLGPFLDQVAEVQLESRFQESWHLWSR